MPRAVLARSRYLLLSFIGVTALFYYYSAPGEEKLAIELESGKLTKLMNHNIPEINSEDIKSSFDWSSVRYEYPPEQPISLPKGRTRTLPKIQYQFTSESSREARKRESRRREVRELFKKNWKSYKKYAWKKDALQPISATFKDQFSGWAATLVDALDTLWIMGLRAEFDEAVAAVAEIDFGKSSTNRINIFETNIRYLGGLLAAYDLSGRKVLLRKAVELGDLIYAAFNTKNRMPVDFMNFETAKTGEGLIVETSVVSAAPGTLSLELTRLAQITGDNKYYDAVAKLMDVFYHGQNKTQIPGMWPMYVSMNTKNVVDGNTFTLAGCADSLYEYLPKMYALLGGLELKYETMTKRFMEAADKHFYFRPMVPRNEDILISGNVNTRETGSLVLDPESEHLTCFIGGTVALAGRLLGNPESVETGLKLTNGCVYAYRAFSSGMMPERYNMIPCESRIACRWNEEKWKAERKKRPEWRSGLPKGFTTAKDPRYILRPEAIESVFVLYRITGKSELQEAAWDMFRAISNGTATEYANAAVQDVVTTRRPLPQEDYMEVSMLSSGELGQEVR
jgi:mannosyl-oligosaccharide alpha-1,2-mannosidase